MKTSRIADGFYEGTYKGQDVQIVRVFLDYSGETLWYCMVNGSDAHDQVMTKKRAISDAVYMIDNASEYGIELK